MRRVQPLVSPPLDSHLRSAGMKAGPPAVRRHGFSWVSRGLGETRQAPDPASLLDVDDGNCSNYNPLRFAAVAREQRLNRPELRTIPRISSERFFDRG